MRQQYYEPDEDYYDDDIADSEQFLDEEEDLDDEDITYYNPQNPGIYSQYQGSEMAQRPFGGGAFGADYDDDEDADPYAQIGSFGGAGGLGARGMQGGLGGRGGVGSLGRGSAGGMSGGLGGGGGLANPMITGGSSGLFGSAISKNPLFTGKHGGQKSTLTFGQSGGPSKLGFGGPGLGLGMSRPQTTGGLSGDNAYDFDIDLSKAKRPTTVKKEPAHKTLTQKASALKKSDAKKNEKRVTIGSATVHEISRDYDQSQNSQVSDKKDIDYRDTGFKKKEQTELEKVREDMKKSISQIQQLKKTEQLAESQEIDASPPSKFGGGIGSGDSSYGNQEFEEESFADKKGSEENSDEEMQRMRKYMEAQMIKPNASPVQKVSTQDVVQKGPEKPAEPQDSSNIDEQFQDSQSFDERMATALPSKQPDSVSLIKKSPSPIIQQTSINPTSTDSVGASKTPTPPPPAPTTVPLITKPVEQEKAVKFSMEPEMIQSGVQKVVYRKEFVNTNDKNFQTDPDLLSGPVPNNREYLLEACLRDEKRAVKRLEEEVRRQKDKLTLLEDAHLKRELQLNSTQQDNAYSREKLKMMEDEVTSANQRINAYKVELAEYIKRIDIVHAEKEDMRRQVERAQEETQRRLRLQEERVKLQLDRTESRAVSDLRHQYEIRLEEKENTLRTKDQEVDYLQQKTNRLEAENKALRVSKKPNQEAQKQIDQLKKEIYVLQVQSKQAKETSGVVSPSAKELEDLQNLVKGYQKENERQLQEIKKLKRDKKATQDLMYKQAKRMRQEQARLAKENGTMLVVNSESTALATLNQMGRGGIIRDSEIDVLKERVERLEQQVKEKQEIIEKKEKEALRSRADLGREALLKELETKERQIDTLTREKSEEAESLNRKIEWYQESQNLLKEKDAVIASKNQEIKKLNLVVRKAKGLQSEKDKLERLEKKDKDLDTEARFRDQEIKLRALETERIDMVMENEQLKAQVKSLEVESITPSKPHLDSKKLKSLEALLKKANQKIEELEKAKSSTKSSALKVENQKLKKKVADLMQQKRKSPVSAPHLKQFLKSAAGNALLKAYHDTMNLKTGIRKRDPREAMFKIDTIFSELQEATGQSQFQKENQDALGVLLSAFEKITHSVHSKSWKEAEKSALHAQGLLLNLLSSNGESLGEDKQKKKSKTTAEVLGDGDQEFWSDFEDDDYDVDQEEDKLALQALYDLQKWAPGNQENILQALGSVKLVKLGKLKNALEVAGFETDPPQAFIAFLRRLDLAPKTGRVVVSDLLHNIKTKPPTWWGQRLRNNSFQARNRVSKMGNCGPIVQSEGVLDFLTYEVLPLKIHAYQKKLTRSILASLVKSSVNYLDDDIQEIESEQQVISKQKLREVLLAQHIPFTRQQMHLIAKLVEKDNSGSLSGLKLQSLFTNPQLFLKEKFQDSGRQLVPKSPRMREDISKELMARIVEQLSKTGRGVDSLKEHFLGFDLEHNEQLNLAAFQKAIAEAKLPLSRIEASQLFLEYASNSELNWVSFLEKLRAAKEVGFSELENKNPNSSTRDLKFKLVQAEETIRNLQKQLSDKIQTPTFQPDYSAQQTLRVRLSEKEGMLGTLNTRLQEVMSENEKLKNERNLLSSDLEECAKDMVEPSRQEYNVLMRKIQMLERRHQERESEVRRKAKHQQDMAQHRIEEIQRVLNKERSEHMQVVEGKNREIASFRMELEGILQEMQALKQYQLKKRQMRATGRPINY